MFFRAPLASLLALFIVRLGELPSVAEPMPAPILVDNDIHARAFVQGGTVLPFFDQQSEDGTSSAEANVIGNEQGAAWLAHARAAFNPIDRALQLHTGAYAQAPARGEHDEYAIWFTGAGARASFYDEVQFFGYCPYDVFQYIHDVIGLPSVLVAEMKPVVGGVLGGNAHITFRFSVSNGPNPLFPIFPDNPSFLMRQDAWYDLGVQPFVTEGTWPLYAAQPWTFGLATLDGVQLVDDRGVPLVYMISIPFAFSMSLGIQANGWPNEVLSYADFSHTASLGSFGLFDPDLNPWPLAPYVRVYSRSGIEYAIASQAVPEPGSASLALLGTLTLAIGYRSTMRRRVAESVGS